MSSNIDQVSRMIQELRDNGVPDRNINIDIKKAKREGIISEISFSDALEVDRVVDKITYNQGYWRAAYDYPTVGEVVFVPMNNEETVFHGFKVVEAGFFTFNVK